MNKATNLNYPGNFDEDRPVNIPGLSNARWCVIGEENGRNSWALYYDALPLDVSPCEYILVRAKAAGECSLAPHLSAYLPDVVPSKDIKDVMRQVEERMASVVMQKITRCPYCGSDKLDSVFDEVIPTILHACEPHRVDESRLYPMRVALCRNCGLAFNASPLPEAVLKDIYENYRYIKPRKNIGISKYDKMLGMLRRYVEQDEFLVEIGASDGFLIDTLIEQGYSHIDGFEPSQEWRSMRNKERIRNEFFTRDTSFSQPVGVFYLMHVLEHFSAPWDILRTMRENLADEGKVIFEVPFFSGIYHQHLIYFSDVFVRRLASDLGFLVVEEEISGDVLRVCLKKSKEILNTGETSGASADALAESLKKRQTEIRENRERLLRHLETADTVFWWGTGSTSIMTLSALGESVCRGKRFVFIDSDEDRKGLVMPVPFLADSPIELPIKACPRMGPSDLLVVASMFSGEILSRIEREGYALPRNIISSIRMV